MSKQARAIEIQALSYAYKSDWTWRHFPVLKNVNLCVNAGESFGFLGPNGAGKTTTIKCILGLIRPQQGTIRIFGRDNRNTAARNSVGYLPEQPYFYDHLTVKEIMEMYATLAGVAPEQVGTSVAETLALLHLTDRARTPLRSLSKGLTQRVAMAQAIIAKPKLLVLDEPFSGLDPLGRKELAELMIQLKSTGTTILMSSHILSDVEFLCDRVSIMVQGELRGVFSLNEIPQLIHGTYELIVRNYEQATEVLIAFSAAHTEHERALVLTFEQRDKAEQALACAIQADVTIESYRFVHGGLEELFVKLVNQKGAQTA